MPPADPLEAVRAALERIADEAKVYLGHGDYDIEPALSAEDAQAEARAALPLLERALEGRDALLELAARPDWTCVECGHQGEFRDIKYDTPGEPMEYDMECPECESRDVRESAREAFSAYKDAQRDKLDLILDSELAGAREQARSWLVEHQTIDKADAWHGLLGATSLLRAVLAEGDAMDSRYSQLRADTERFQDRHDAELARLRDIINPGAAAEYEEGMAALRAQLAASRERERGLEAALDDAIRTWSFNDRHQNHTHSWHDREDWYERHAVARERRAAALSPEKEADREVR